MLNNIFVYIFNYTITLLNMLCLPICKYNTLTKKMLKTKFDTTIHYNNALTKVSIYYDYRYIYIYILYVHNMVAHNYQIFAINITVVLV